MSDEHRKSFEPGLRRRMRYEGERINSQHTQLGELHELVAAELESGEVHSARRSFERFEEALKAHLEVEERIYFPALHGLRPALEDDIAQLMREHDSVVALLPSLRGLLRSGEIELSRERLRELAHVLSAHEAREEALVQDCLKAQPARVEQSPRDDSSHTEPTSHVEPRAGAPAATERLARSMHLSEDEEDM